MASYLNPLFKKALYGLLEAPKTIKIYMKNPIYLYKTNLGKGIEKTNGFVTKKIS